MQAAPKSDVYVALLGVALAAIVIACLLMFLVFNRYEMKIKPSFVPSQPAALVACISDTGKISSIRL